MAWLLDMQLNELVQVLSIEEVVRVLIQYVDHMYLDLIEIFGLFVRLHARFQI